MNKTMMVAGVAVLAASAAWAEIGWVTGAYDSRDWDPAEGNILRLESTKLLESSAVVRGIGTYASDTNDPALLTDGKGPNGTYDTADLMSASSGHAEWSFAQPMYVSEVRVFSRWGDGGRDGIAIDAINVKTSAEGEWVALDGGSVSYGCGDNNTAGTLSAILKDTTTEGAEIASGIVALQVVFSNAQDNSGTGYAEIEVIGSDQPIVPPAPNVWQTGGAWPMGANFVPGVNNVLKDLSPSDDSQGVDGTKESCGGPSQLTNGEANGSAHGGLCSVATDNVFAYTLNEAADIREFRFYSIWGDNGRDSINIRAIKVKKQGSEKWITLANSAVAPQDDPSFRNYAFFKKADGSALATDVIAVQFCFGAQENGWTGYAEFEALAIGGEPTGRVEVETRGCDHVVLNGLVTGLGKGAAQADFYFTYQEGESAEGLSLEGAASRGSVTQPDQAVTVTLEGLKSQTTYAYLYKIVNDKGVATTEATGTFSTAQLVPVVDNEWLTVPDGDWAIVSANQKVSGFDNRGTMIVKAGVRLEDGDGFGESSKIGVGTDADALLTIEEGAFVEAHSGKDQALAIGASGGRGALVVGPRATLTTGLNRIVLANGTGTYANLAIYGTVSASAVQPNAYWPGNTLSTDPLGRPIASETTVYAGGKLSTGSYQAWDFARCNLTLAGGTLEITQGGDQFFNNNSAKATIVLAIEPAATASVIDVGANNVTFTRPGKDWEDPAPAGTRTLFLLGTGALEKRGTGTLTVTERMNLTKYSGAVSVAEGTLALDGAAATFASLTQAEGTFLTLMPGASLTVKEETTLSALRISADYDYTQENAKAKPVLDGVALAVEGVLDLTSASARDEVLTEYKIAAPLTFTNVTVPENFSWPVTFNGQRTAYLLVVNQEGEPILKRNQGFMVIVK